MPNAWYGTALAADGSYAALTAIGEGKVYVYELLAQQWSLAQTLDVPTGFLGSPLALKGDWLVVGEETDSPQGAMYAGSAHVYHRENGTWIPISKLTASDNKAGALFGRSVAMDGATLVIGAPNHHLPVSGYGHGAAYVFERQGVTWVEIAKLTASHPFNDGMFGHSVAVDGSRLVVGALHQYSPVVGSAYVFERSAGTWIQEQRLLANDGTPGDYFGYAVGIHAGIVVVGAPKHAMGPCCPLAGAAYIFTEESSAWTQKALLAAADPTPVGSGGFGFALSMAWPDLVIGSPFDFDFGLGTGSAYHFRDTAIGWVQRGKLLPVFASKPLTAGSGWGLGSGLAMGRGCVLAGAPDDTEAIPPGGLTETGAMYVFQLASEAIQYCSCATQGPCHNHDDHGGCKGSTGQGAVLQACSSGSVSTDNLKIETRWMPENVPAIVIMGPRADETPYGDGILCVGPGDKGLFRFPGGNSGPEGVIKLGPGIVAYSHANFLTAGHIQPGDTWYFQAWYRDPNGPCGSGFNLSNGLKVEFTQ